ncbi:Hsp20/alpha crystallin family protein [Paenibacillus sepulcri]|uniref:Hsp20/alpha crystallin family protein n=1 Tax=Paenibacillus sepulcri TaxID=359917 RepID=A0ABS7C510_9BACL|nr:Hsp20/alpha crystallin family protein [Paenibacillus sepulcri]
MLDLVPFRKRNEDVSRSLMKSFHDIFNEDFFAPMRSNTHPFRTDIHEREDAFLIESELPGFSKADIDISYSNHYLTIKASRNQEQNVDGEDHQVIRRERYYGEFVRRFYVENIKDDQISASFENGILKLEIPKKEKAQSVKKRIEIQ